MKQTHHMVVNTCYLYTLVWALLSKHFNKFQPTRTATINPNEKGNECKSAFFDSWCNYFHGVLALHARERLHFVLPILKCRLRGRSLTYSEGASWTDARPKLTSWLMVTGCKTC